jgi:predicted RNase H-like HicB family nuclease
MPNEKDIKAARVMEAMEALIEAQAEYVDALRSENTKLEQKLDQALVAAIAEGKIE